MFILPIKVFAAFGLNFFSYLPAALPLKETGAVANITMRWRSNGTNSCPASCYAKGEYCQSKTCHTKCVSKSVSCLGGTGRQPGFEYQGQLRGTCRVRGGAAHGDMRARESARCAAEIFCVR